MFQDTKSLPRVGCAGPHSSARPTGSFPLRRPPGHLPRSVAVSPARPLAGHVFVPAGPLQWRTPSGLLRICRARWRDEMGGSFQAACGGQWPRVLQVPGSWAHRRPQLFPGGAGSAAGTRPPRLPRTLEARETRSLRSGDQRLPPGGRRVGSPRRLRGVGAASRPGSRAPQVCASARVPAWARGHHAGRPPLTPFHLQDPVSKCRHVPRRRGDGNWGALCSPGQPRLPVLPASQPRVHCPMLGCSSARWVRCVPFAGALKVPLQQTEQGGMPRR